MCTGWGPYAYFQTLAESQNGAQFSSTNNDIISPQPNEMHIVSMPPHRDGNTARGNIWDPTPVFDVSQSARR